MSNVVRAEIFGAYGPVLSGAGVQQNIYLAPLIDDRGRTPRRQAADDLQRLFRCFAYPDGFDRARGILESTRTVFLDGPEGAGRITTAKMLLWERRRDADQFVELLRIDDDPPIRLDDVNDGDRLWLDLSGVSRVQWNQVRPELPALRQVAQERAAHLVVVLPHNLRDHPADLNPYRVTIERCSVREVMLNHLRSEGLRPPDPPTAGTYLDPDAPLRDVPEFVRRVVEARVFASGAGTITDWCERASQAMAVREHDVAHQLETVTDGAQRALLLVTGMLHGAHAESIHSAALLLQQKTGHPADETPMLARTPLDQRLAQVGAETDEAGHVRFSRPGYDAAVRAFLWRNLPELHESIRDWVASVADMPGLDDEEYADVVRRFIERCLAPRYLPVWSRLVEQMTGDGAGQRSVRAATLALQHGLRNDTHSGIFRRQIYDWATTAHLAHRLGETIVVACRDEMVVNHPDAAMTRLHHVARRETGTSARSALFELIGNDHRFRRQMLARMAAHMRPDRWPIDNEIFVHTSDPAALTMPGPYGRAPLSSARVRGQLITCWSCVFERSPASTWAAHAANWMDAAAANHRHADTLLAALVTAAGTKSEVLAHLYRLTRVAGPRSGLSGLLLQKIDDAQEMS